VVLGVGRGCRRRLGQPLLSFAFPFIPPLPLGFGFRLLFHFALPLQEGVLVFDDGFSPKKGAS
jgi:hypothetical protein